MTRRPPQRVRHVLVRSFGKETDPIRLFRLGVFHTEDAGGLLTHGGRALLPEDRSGEATFGLD